MELSENCPKGAEMHWQEEISLSKRKRKAWEWSSVDGEAFLFRKPFFEAGKWRCRKLEKATGKVQRITLEASTLTEAKREVAELAEKDRRRTPMNGEEGIKIAFGKAVDDWIFTVDVRKVTHDSYKRITRVFKKLIGEEKYVNELEYKDLERLFNNDWKNKKGKTKIEYRNLLKRFFDWCLKHNYCKVNLADKIGIQKKWTNEAREGVLFTGKALTYEEAKKVLNACKERTVINFPYKKKGLIHKREEELEYIWWFIFISLRTGLRKSNVVGSDYKEALKWKNIDLENGTLKIEKDCMKNGLEFHVPIHDELLASFKKRISDLGRIPSPDEYLVKIRSIKKSFLSVLKKAGLEGKKLRIHDLRHTFGTWLGEHCTYMVMKRLLGHTASNVTERYAQHQSMEVLREGLNKLPWLLTEEKTDKTFSDQNE